MIVLATRNTELSGGHHADFYALFEVLFQKNGLSPNLSTGLRQRIFTKEPVFFLMIEEYPAGFLIVALTRALLRRRTAGLLFRVGECARPGSLRTWTKNIALRVLKKNSYCSVIAMFPLEIDKSFEKIARFGIYDPQMWDLDYLPPVSGMGDARFVDELNKAAGSRKIITAIGSQTQNKGFNYFCDIWCEESNFEIRQKYLFVSAGKVAGELSQVSRRFAKAGGYLIDRLLTHTELTALYKRSDLIWCCYDPIYNQASGIFGRAVQYGTPAVVRKDSYLSLLRDMIDHPIEVLEWTKPRTAGHEILKFRLKGLDQAAANRTVKELRSLSLARLSEAIGIKLNP